jgi:hypothetical protein
MNEDFEDADHGAGPSNPSQGSMAPSASNHSSNAFTLGPAQVPAQGPVFNYPRIPSGYYAQGHQPMDYDRPVDHSQDHQPGSPQGSLPLNFARGIPSALPPQGSPSDFVSLPPPRASPRASPVVSALPTPNTSPEPLVLQPPGAFVTVVPPVSSLAIGAYRGGPDNRSQTSLAFSDSVPYVAGQFDNASGSSSSYSQWMDEPTSASGSADQQLRRSVRQRGIPQMYEPLRTPVKSFRSRLEREMPLVPSPPFGVFRGIRPFGYLGSASRTQSRESLARSTSRTPPVPACMDRSDSFHSADMSGERGPLSLDCDAGSDEDDTTVQDPDDTEEISFLPVDTVEKKL